jgi:hypothetical protein
MTPIGWSEIGLIWLYDIVWFLVMDVEARHIQTDRAPGRSPAAISPCHEEAATPDGRFRREGMIMPIVAVVEARFKTNANLRPMKQFEGLNRSQRVQRCRTSTQ